MVALSLRLEGEEDERAAVAVLRAARLLTGGGRLALAAALRRGSRLGLQVRIDLLKFSVFAAGPATEMLGHVGTLGGLEAAADAAFNPEDTADWLQLATSGLLSCCTGGPLASAMLVGEDGSLIDGAQHPPAILQSLWQRCGGATLS